MGVLFRVSEEEWTFFFLLRHVFFISFFVVSHFYVTLFLFE